MTERLYSVKETALTLHISDSTVRRMVRKGQIKAVKLPTGTIRIPESEILKLLGVDKPWTKE
ncbi:MAG: helix-turn-helix domain-containing protein [Nitrososphaerota archaeon]|nr:helix-turn-helix domain-containing protein [Nitrososphaerota archaeon]MDG6929658.1 helix-turn-helix domain-containing protein [Nitrososphaerota archaeon]